MSDIELTRSLRGSSPPRDRTCLTGWLLMVQGKGSRQNFRRRESGGMLGQRQRIAHRDPPLHQLTRYIAAAFAEEPIGDGAQYSPAGNEREAGDEIVGRSRCGDAERIEIAQKKDKPTGGAPHKAWRDRRLRE